MEKLYDPDEVSKVQNLLEKKLITECGFYRDDGGQLMHPRRGKAAMAVEHYLTRLSYLWYMLSGKLKYKWYLKIDFFGEQKLLYGYGVGSYNYNKAINKLILVLQK
jgi:hypothetical protein